MNNNLTLDMAAFQFGGNGAGVSQKDFDLAGMGAESLFNLSKAMQAGQLQGGDIGNPAQTNAGALKHESLEPTLKVITFTENEIRLYKRVPKAPAYNTFEEFNQLTSYGSQGGSFTNEGELPEEEDSQYIRKGERVKFMGVTASVTHPLQLVRTQVGDIMAQENENKIRYLLQQADFALLYGDEALVSQEWNGLYAQHMNNTQYSTLAEYMEAPTVIDLRGQSMAENDLDEGARVLLEAFAQPNLLIAPPVVLSDFARNFYARQRLMLGGDAAVRDVTTGNHISKFQAQFGLIEFDYDVFAARGAGRASTAGATHAKAPAAPTPDATTPAAAVADAASTKFGDGAGDYYYAVAAVNRFGVSAMVQLGAGAITVSATQAVDLIFTATAGPYPTTSYVVYRSKINPAGAFNATTMYPILYVPATGTDAKRGSLAAGVDGGAAGTVRDRNRWLPGTEQAAMMQDSNQVYEFKQLAPLMKMDIARLAPADRWMVLLYATLLLYQPSKMVRYINIGRA